MAIIILNELQEKIDYESPFIPNLEKTKLFSKLRKYASATTFLEKQKQKIRGTQDPKNE